MPAESKPDHDLLDRLAAGAYDFVDFGCSGGGSMDFAARLLGGGRGLGLDNNPNKVAAARQRGFDAACVDAATVRPARPVVRFALMSHFLEHLPDLRTAGACIDAALAMSRDFLLVRQPFFDADGYLLRQGLKMAFADWPNHPNPMTSLDFYKILRGHVRDRTARSFLIFGKKPLSRDPAPPIVDLDAPSGMSAKAPDLADHRTRPVELQWELFREIVVVVEKTGAPADTWRQVAAGIKPDALLVAAGAPAALSESRFASPQPIVIAEP